MLIPSTIPPSINAPLIAIIRSIEVPKPAPKIYTIQTGDTLTSIAKAQNVDLSRLWAKNTQLTNPDAINAGDPLNVPETSESLAPRAMISTSTGQTTPRTAVTGGSSSSSTSNTYDAGQCVWYMKNIVPWVQNGWGNASNWKYASKHTVSVIPQVGAIAWARGYSHVALVTAVGDGNVTVTEMNYVGEGKVSTRTAPVTEFEYILP